MLIDFHRIGLGTVQLGLPYGIANEEGKPDDKEAAAILSMASSLGIDLVDTASAYGDSEFVIGRLAKGKFKVVSKWIEDPEEDLVRSLDRLKTTQLYAWLAHRPDQLIAKPDIWKILKAQQSEGRVQKIGFSVYHPDELQILLDNKIFPSMVQLPFNAIDNRFEKWLEPLKEIGCEVHCRSVYLQGLLLMEPEKLDDFFKPIKDWLKELNRQLPNKLDRMSALIHEILKRKEIDRLILGVDNHQQLKELREALSISPVSIPEVPEIPEEIMNPSLWQLKN